MIFTWFLFEEFVPLSDEFNLISRVIGFWWKLVIAVIGIDYILTIVNLEKCLRHVFMEIGNCDDYR